MRMCYLQGHAHHIAYSNSLIMGAMFVLFDVLLVALFCCRHVEPAQSVLSTEFSQTTVELLPCEKPSSQLRVSLYNSTLITVVANLTHCQSLPQLDTTIVS